MFIFYKFYNFFKFFKYKKNKFWKAGVIKKKLIFDYISTIIIVDINTIYKFNKSILLKKLFLVLIDSNFSIIFLTNNNILTTNILNELNINNNKYKIININNNKINYKLINLTILNKLKEKNINKILFLTKLNNVKIKYFKSKNITLVCVNTIISNFRQLICLKKIIIPEYLYNLLEIKKKYYNNFIWQKKNNYIWCNYSNKITNIIEKAFINKKIYANYYIKNDKYSWKSLKMYEINLKKKIEIDTITGARVSIRRLIIDHY